MYNVDANIDASDNAILGNEPSSEMLTSQNQKLTKKRQDLSTTDKSITLIF